MDKLGSILDLPLLFVPRNAGRAAWALLAALVVALLLAGCTTKMVTTADGTEMPADTYVALESMDSKKEAREKSLNKLMGGIQECPEGLAKDEYKDCQHTNQLWLVQVPWIAQSLDEGGVDAGYWSLQNVREQRRDPIRWIGAFNDTLQSMCITGLAPWTCAIGGTTGGVTVKADRGSEIHYSGTIGDKSPYVKGEEHMVGVDETQQVPGSNNQTTRSTTRPSQFSQPDLRGGDAGDDGTAGDAGDLNAGSEGAEASGAF